MRRKDCDNPGGDVVVCQGPPICELEGDVAVTRQKQGCLYCQRIWFDECGNEFDYNPVIFLLDTEWRH